MGCDYYDIIGDTYIKFSDDADYCLCSFPEEDEEDGASPERLLALAMLGAAVVMHHKGALDGPIFLPHALPAWFRADLDKLRSKLEDDMKDPNMTELINRINNGEKIEGAEMVQKPSISPTVNSYALRLMVGDTDYELQGLSNGLHVTGVWPASTFATLTTGTLFSLYGEDGVIYMKMDTHPNWAVARLFPPDEAISSYTAMRNYHIDNKTRVKKRSPEDLRALIKRAAEEEFPF